MKVRMLKTGGRCFTLAVIILLTVGALAQTSTSSLSGNVTDSSGSAVPKASVRATLTQQNQTFNVATDSAGHFTFANLPPGTYTITVQMQGFKALTKTNINLENNSAGSAGEFSLAVGEVTESIQVSSAGLHVETENVERSDTITTTQMQNTPVNGRSFVPLVQLTPGVTSYREQQTAAPQGGLTMTINGGGWHQNQYALDGITDIEPGGGGDQIVTVSQDSVSQFRILTHNFGAEYGRSAGSQLIATTRSGTSEFHGGGYIFHQHEGLNANNWLNKRNGQPRNLYRFNDPGFNIGGPVYIPKILEGLRQKAFFFVGIEFQRQLRPQSARYVRVPTSLERTGDFSKTLDKNGRPYPYIRDYQTNLPCNANNTSGCFKDGGILGKVPQSRLSSLGLRVLQAYPLANYSNAANPGSNFVSQIPDQYPRREDTYRIDLHPTSSLSGFVRFIHNADQILTYYGGYSLGTSVATSPFLVTDPANGLAVGITKIFNANTVNEIVIGYNAGKITVDPTTDRLTRSANNLSDLPVLYPNAITADLLPDFNFNGTGSVMSSSSSLTGGNNELYRVGTTNIDVADNFTKILGRHTLKLGFLFERSRKAESILGSVGGSYDFGDNSTNPYDTQYGFSNAATGTFYSFTQKSAWFVPQFRYSETDFYAQDTWRVSPRLTAILGMRFMHWTPYHDISNRSSSFDTSAFDPSQAPRIYYPVLIGGQRVAQDRGTGAIAPSTAIGKLVPNSGSTTNGLVTQKQRGSSLTEIKPLLYSPRVGFTYDLTGRGTSVLRAGAGIYYDRYSLVAIRNLIQNAPTVYQPTLYNGTFDTVGSGSALLSPGSAAALDSRGLWPTSYEFNMGIQQELPAKFLADISYVGTRSSHLLQSFNPAYIPYGAAFQAANQDPVKVAQNPNAKLGSNAYDQVYLSPYRGYNSIQQYQFGASSNYNALQVQLNRRYVSGLFISVAYTWGKSLGTTTAEYDGVDVLGRGRQLNYAPNNSDRRNTFTTNYIYPFPRMFKTDGILHSVVDGWQVSGITRLWSGTPYSMGYSINGYTNANITGSYTQGGRIQMIGNPFSGTGSSPYNRVNASAFAPPQVGNKGVGQRPNQFYTPGLNGTDLSLQKSFAIHHENWKVVLRADAFNAFNHPQFTGINSTVTFTDLNGTIQPGSTAQGGNLSGFGSISSVADPRIMQLVARFNF